MDERTVEIEMNHLLEAIYERYGYDFRSYNRASLLRRIRFVLHKYELKTISELQGMFLHDKDKLTKLLSELTIVVTEMFRDPHFFLEFREKVVPHLHTYPFLRIWHAGCGTGEEVYSMAILLHEEGLLERTTLYATDINYEALRTARSGIYSNSLMRTYTKNYIQSGGKAQFSDYYHSAYDFAKIEDYLQKNIVFADHNLVTDSGFNEMNVILCRNVLIYFKKNLQERVLGLFRDSLVHRGFLCLGTKETLRFTEVETNFNKLNDDARIYQRVY